MQQTETQIQTAHNLSTDNLEQQHLDARREALELKRATMVDGLVACGELSQDFVQSGALDRFAIDPKVNSDSFAHILVGDVMGGFHHWPTANKLNVKGRSIASKIRNSASEEENMDDAASHARYRYKQTLRDQPAGKFRGEGEFRAIETTIEEDGQIISKASANGSCFFPLDWSAEKSLTSIIDVVDNSEGKYDEQRNSYSHKGISDGITVRVVTQGAQDPEGRTYDSSKIITGYPIVREKG